MVPDAAASLRRELEPAIHRIGGQIFERADAASPGIGSIEFWQNSGMQWLTGDPALKMRLFRFIEVLPALRSPASIARHLREYVADSDEIERLAAPIQGLLSFRRDEGLHARLAAWAARVAGGVAARRFVCGTTPEEAIRAVRAMRRQGMTFTLDVLGETVISERVAREMQSLYLQLIDELSDVAPAWPAAPMLDEAPWGPLPRVNVSIKLTGLVTRFDPIDPAGAMQSVLDRLRPILAAARRRGAFINVDMEHYAVKDLTLEVFKRVLTEPEFLDWPDCGIVIQAYLPEWERDLRDLIAWTRRRGTPIHVRLVKGAYWDAETAAAIYGGRPIPVYTRKWESDAAFERAAWMLLSNSDAVRPAFASHNVRSIAAALAMQDALDLPPRTLEIQMLTGMGDPLKRALVDMGQRLRVYAPFGSLMTGMAYLIRRLIENTANESFLRQSFGGQTPVRELLRDPTEHDSRNGGGAACRVASPRATRPFIQDPDASAEMNPFANEPEIEFVHAEARDAMHAALASACESFGARYPAVVDGRPVAAPAWFDSRNPARPSQVVGRTALCDETIADRAVAAARRALADWSAASPHRRAEIIEQAGDRLHDRRFEFAAWLVYEVGKTWPEAHGDVTEAIDYLRYYAYEMRRLADRPRLRNFAGESNEFLYRPRGVVAVISPVSFPLALLTGMTAAALVAGNTVIAKPATQASVSAARLAALLAESGLPAGALNFVPGRGEVVGAHLARHPGVDMVAFTGSSRVGASVVESARRFNPATNGFRHVIADMGGKNAILVDNDADLDEAVQATIASAFGFCGQKCTSCSRVVVLPEVHDEFCAKLVEAAEGIRPGPPHLPGTSVGPMIDAAAVQRARRWVEIGKTEARCLLDGERASPQPENEEAGYYVGPAIFADVPPDARIAQEELLAPILCVIRAESFEQAIDVANGTAYGLTAGVFSRSPSHVEMARRRLTVGTLYINRKTTVSRVDRQPFGGFKYSGLGAKAGGPDYLREFMLAQTVCENTMRHGFAPAGEAASVATAP